jgi:hypothetical protein
MNRNLTKEQAASSVVNALLYDSSRLTKQEVHGLGYCSRSFRRLARKKLKLTLYQLAMAGQYSGDVRDERYQRELDAWCLPTQLDKVSVAFPANMLVNNSELSELVCMVPGSVAKIRGQHIVLIRATEDCTGCAFKDMVEPCRVQCRTFIYKAITPWQAFLHKWHIKRLS